MLALKIIQINLSTTGIGENMYNKLEEINSRPKPFEFYTVRDLWTDEYTSKKMLACHLDGEVDLSSRNAEFINRSVKWIVSFFNVGPKTTIADFGCGPGLYAIPLAREKANVTGIDFSRRSIQHARGVALSEELSVKFLNRDYLEFETGERFNLIIMIMCDFCALSPVQRAQLLKKFHSFLVPGGSILLDVHSYTDFEQREEVALYEANLLDGFWSPEDYYGFLNTVKYEKEKVILDKYTLISETRTWTVYNWLQYFTPGTLKEEFEAAGFTIKNIYADVAGAPYVPESKEFAVVAHKQ